MDIRDPRIDAILKTHLSAEEVVNPDIINFIGNYLICRQLAQASRASNLTVADGRFLFNQSHIYRCIEDITKLEIVKYGFDGHEVVARVKEIAEFDPAMLARPDGTYIKNIHDVPPEARRAIKKIRVRNTYEVDANGIPQYNGEVIEYEFIDKMKALPMLASEKDVMKKTVAVEHDIGKNAGSMLLASMRLAVDHAKETLAIDVTPPRVVFPPLPGVKG